MREELGQSLFAIFFIFAAIYQLTNIETIKEEKIALEYGITFDDVKYVYINEKPKAHKEIKNKIKNKKKVYALSKKGKDFIKRHETCKLRAYNDPDRFRRSIGWGHQLRPNEHFEQITMAKADELFDKDIKWVNDAINRILSKADRRFEYSQGFIDGLGSLIYNCGERGVTLTKFYDRLCNCRYDKNGVGNINKNDLYYAIAAVKSDRISAKGHIERRYNEHLLMLD